MNPTTGEVEQEFAPHDATEVERRIALAQAAFEQIQSTTFAQRGEWLRRAADQLEADVKTLGATLVREMGKTIGQAEAEVLKCAKGLRFYADNVESMLEDEWLADPSKVGASKAGAKYYPIGVVLAVMPWNYPLWQAIRFAAPALAASNVGLLKHASNVPQTALYLDTLFSLAEAHLFMQVGIRGCMQLVHAAGFASHPGLHGVACCAC